MNCKHNWNFISADTDTLKCQRCGVETGPKPYEQRVKDMLKEPRAFSTKNLLPDYLHEDLCLAVERLEKIVLEKS